MSTVFTPEWLLGAVDRAVKSAAQSLLLLGAAGPGLDLVRVDWAQALSLAGGAVVLSVLTSVVSAPVGDGGSSAMIPGAR